MNTSGDMPSKLTWEPMTFTYVGDAGELLEGGGGKMSTSPQDPGEIFKPPGGG
jgi:hypothetical protein